MIIAPLEVTHPVPTARFNVEQETPAEFLPEAISLLNATRRDEFEERRLRWLYLDNPDGAALVWVVRSGESGEVAGFAAALPRRMVVAGRNVTCLNCADLSVHPSFRRQGVATLLRSATRAAVDDRRYAFLYAHPNDLAAGAHERAGHVCIGQMQRWARPIRFGRFLAEKVGGGSISSLFATMVDRTTQRVSKMSPRHILTSVHLEMNVEFNERFDLLWKDSRCVASVFGVRDSEYLNWRYANSPLYDVHASVAERDGELCGFLLFRIEDGVACLLDLWPPTEPVILRDLLVSAIGEWWKLGLKSASFTALNESGLQQVLTRCGFRRRAETSDMFAHASADHPDRSTIESKDAWYVTVGDRDV